MTHLRALSDPRLDLAHVLAHDPRAFTFEELAAMSSVRRVRTAIGRGEIVRMMPGVYAAALHAVSFAVRADAALLWAGTDAALAGDAALYVWGLIPEPPAAIELLLPHSRRLEAPDWILLRRTTVEFRAVRRGRATVVTPELAVCLGFGGLPRRDRDQVVFRAVQLRLVSPPRLQRTLDELPRCRARRDLGRVIDSCARGAESNLEEHGLRRVFRPAEFSRFLRQHRVFANGLFYRLDMYDPATMTAVELDGAAFHSTPEQRQRDLRRDADLASVGIQTVRISNRDLRERPDWCRRLVREVLKARTRAEALP